MTSRISALFVYPVKSCAGISVTRADLDAHGIRFDRHWVVMNSKNGRAVTQREAPALARVCPTFHADGIMLAAEGMLDLRVPFGGSNRHTTVVVSKEQCAAHDQGESSARWFSAFLDFPCRFVRYNLRAPRRMKQFPGTVNFADAFPLLVASESSLADLNSRLTTPISMDRFRPNVVISGCPPYDEDSWQEWRVGDSTLHMVKPCTRCMVTTTDQKTGFRDGGEPLRTLGEYRRWTNPDGKTGVIFGMNAVHANLGALRIGDPVTVLSHGDRPLL